MKVKGLYALAMLLTSSLANADVANLDDQYYAGLNLGAGWGSDFVMKPLVPFLVIIIMKTLNLSLRLSVILNH